MAYYYNAEWQPISSLRVHFLSQFFTYFYVFFSLFSADFWAPTGDSYHNDLPFLFHLNLWPDLWVRGKGIIVSILH